MLPALLLIPLVVLFRVFLAWQPAGAFYNTILPGACPLSAVALCAGMFLPRRLALTVPLSVLLLLGPVAAARLGWPGRAAARWLSPNLGYRTDDE